MEELATLIIYVTIIWVVIAVVATLGISAMEKTIKRRKNKWR